MREIAWVERQEDGVKRETRVNLVGKKLKWQFKRADAERWDYDSVPTTADWDAFIERMEHRCQRRRGVDDESLKFFRKLRQESGR